ncbi:hypothetical protein SNOG_03813 [Parastagonospora nodorum SN15]|uniref:Uncharacterized protein n=1 Tax=Phaeosphaeria nodorum (strain SN15 / ATCC MYA-4574 / FGSC 10173) TaxID=321614 RepID=Q0UWQ1_PHANO|nr:hypothetical protein SNOG_03813 [Parastagonospora nodorum SN15]EAT89018.2 hypothetical protein SNOG_03813 [Parastagonospora nodorum SN15]
MGDRRDRNRWGPDVDLDTRTGHPAPELGHEDQCTLRDIRNAMFDGTLQDKIMMLAEIELILQSGDENRELKQRIIRITQVKQAMGQSNTRLVAFVKMQQDGFHVAKKKAANEKSRKLEDSVAAAHSTARDQIAALESQAKEQLDKARAEIDSIRLIETQTQDQVDKALADMEMLRAQNEKVRQDLLALRRAEQVLRKDSEALRKEIARLKKDVQIQTTLRRNAVNETEEIRLELTELSTQQISLAKDNSKHRHTLKIWEARVIALTEEREAALKQVQELDGKYFSARVWQKAAKDREADLKLKKARIRQLLKANDENEEHTAKLQSEAEERVQDLVVQHEAEIHDRDEFIAKLQQKNVPKKKLKHQLKVLEDEKGTVEKRFEALCDYYRNLYGRNKSLVKVLTKSEEAKGYSFKAVALRKKIWKMKGSTLESIFEDLDPDSSSSSESQTSEAEADVKSEESGKESD